jgi:hypothetical protein
LAYLRSLGVDGTLHCFNQEEETAARQCRIGSFFRIGVPAVSDHPRPLLLGYIRADVLTTCEDLTMAEGCLAAFAGTEGFTLGTVYVERGDAAPDAFQALMDEIRHLEDAWAVVVPDLRHLADGERRVMRTHRRDDTGVCVLVAALAP